MTERNTGGPAFPSGAVHKTRPASDSGGDFRVMSTTSPVHAGMTLRDYFAAKVLVGTLSDPHGNQESSLRQIAEFCYELADHMLEARNV